MTDSSAPLDPSTSSDVRQPNAPRDTVSRRRLLGSIVGVVGGSAVGLAGLDAARASGRAAELNLPADALAPARRVPPSTSTTLDSTVPPDSTTPDSTTSTDPEVSTTVPPVPDGQIRFPIVVGEDDFCWVSDSFGDCRGSGCSRSHEGVDIMADHMLPVVAPVSGRLTKRYVDYGSTGGAGNGWTLLDEDADITYKFFHLDSHADDLEVDDEVEAGQIIGYVGNTGTSGAYSGTNHHLHFEYRPGNVPADSFHLLDQPDFVDFEGQ